MTRRLGLPTILVAGAASALLAACGGSGGKDGTGGKPDDSKQLAFAACLRKAGIDAPDPQRDANGGLRQELRVPKGISPKRMEQIQKDCQRKSGFAPKPPSKEQQARFFDRALKFARCMRAHGVDVPDPQPAKGGIVIQKRGAGAANVGPDIESPAFRRAQQACQSLMPGPMAKSGGPGVTSSGAGER
ncbi:MAG TPA: hypothetical protein VE570_02555 [Thermoleophilaceae bacterium]|jgi:hypothetical protein|nr:hypothetical protein [Thermoleophilaceae bacterium]